MRHHSIQYLCYGQESIETMGSDHIISIVLCLMTMSAFMVQIMSPIVNPNPKRNPKQNQFSFTTQMKESNNPRKIGEQTVLTYLLAIELKITCRR